MSDARTELVLAMSRVEAMTTLADAAKAWAADNAKQSTPGDHELANAVLLYRRACDSQPISKYDIAADDVHDTAALDALIEMRKARRNWPAYNSAHEAYGVLVEEVAELFDHVRMNQTRRDLDAMRKEAVQVAAVAIRFAAEVCGRETGRK